MGINTKSIQSFAVKTAFWLNIAVAAVYIASAYAGYADPRSCGYLSLLVLAFPIFLVALLCFAVLWTVVCRRNLWVTGAAIVLTIPQLLAFCPLNFGSELSEKHDFRIMTYNTFGMPEAEQGATIADEILLYNPDFVCMQETPDTQGIKYRYKGLLWDELTARYPHIDVCLTTSLGYLSKRPVKTVEVYDDNKYFCYAVYQSSIGNRLAFIINTHLESIGLTKSDKRLYMGLTSPKQKHSIRGVRSRLMSKLRNAFEQRAEQAEIIRAKADSLHTAQPEAVVMICGDFNDTPYSYAYLTAKGDLCDAYRDGGFGPLKTYYRNRFYFHIDHILYSGDFLDATACRRGSSQASDHYPLVADFMIKKPT